MPNALKSVVMGVSVVMLGTATLLAFAQPKEGEKKVEAQPAKATEPAKPADPAKPAAAPKGEAPMYETADGKDKLAVMSRSEIKLVMEDLRVGSGAEAKSASTVTILYHGQLTDGSVFDSTRNRNNEASTFPLRNLIQGWQLGIPGMKVGGVRRLTIPWQLAYGEAGRPPMIPAKADLIFTIELKGVQ